MNIKKILDQIICYFNHSWTHPKNRSVRVCSRCKTRQITYPFDPGRWVNYPYPKPGDRIPFKPDPIDWEDENE